MRWCCLAALYLLTAAPLLAAAGDSAAGLLAKAADVFVANQERARHWNWTIHETRWLVDKAGKVLQNFPSVDSESVIRTGGKRCNAVIAWGDGKTPYMLDADPDTRCQAMDTIRAPFQVEALLRSSRVKLVSQSAGGIALAISPDKSKLRDSELAVRCTSSIRATVRLDPATFFPTMLEGEVVESGCNAEGKAISHYEAVQAGPATTTFRKSARFRMEYALQKDKFQNPANSFWICVRQEFDQPWNSGARFFYYWGRQLTVHNPGAGYRVFREAHTSAHEFGAETQLRFVK